MTSLTVQATAAAILAAGLTTRLTRALQVEGVPLVPQGPPGIAETGFSCAGSKAVDIRVSLHRDARARSVFLQIDRAAAPLTGNYLLEIDTVVSTYDATADAPADIDELLTAWAAAIVASFATYTATPGAFSGSPTDAHDGILVTGPTGTGAYATFSIGTSTAAPELAALNLWYEVDDCSLTIWTKSGMQLPDESTLAWQTTMAQGWTVARNVGAIGGGYDERADLAARTAVWPQLHTFVETDEALAIAGSGAGIYGLHPVAVVAVAPTVQP